MKKQMTFVVDVDRCLGCFTCAMACKNQYQLEPGIKWRDVVPAPPEVLPIKERAFYSLACNHCENPVCAEVCPVNAHVKREKDGIVVHTQPKCIACMQCIETCPYGAPKFNTKVELAEKCSFCHHRLDAGLEAACVQSCPVGALRRVELTTVKDWKQYPPGFLVDKKLNPSIRFRLPTKPFIVKAQDS